MRRAARFLEGVNGPFYSARVVSRPQYRECHKGSLRSFQLTNQAIDSYQNSESEMHSH